ncbi:hypothetical protein CC1G_15457 [Coprinopsis cinerea okayama7|uniref:ABC transmembrane type-1 domain-containing protein n=1 Tax=Coprinopsis cinerea (strain Okayama-7 / 130 / ATCC MYA-4618 / FGSC 9003) TaxID=240176 RepID=D6RQP9_COPC7|nr:hypothetical protein CC1G_15457 [Coprinopsis cinerea okayama7\|eukprot:XP_002910180.1 hypothetical protein CC1G_15457 [Coprinopsis cinerea okayama7\
MSTHLVAQTRLVGNLGSAPVVTISIRARFHLWSLPASHLTQDITERVEANFYRRCDPSKRPKHLKPSLDEENAPSQDSSAPEAVPNVPADKENSQFDESLFKAFHQTIALPFWVAGVLNLISDTLRTTTPLVSQVFLKWLTEAYFVHQSGGEENLPDGVPAPKGIGYGIGLAFAIFAMQQIASLTVNYSVQMTMTLGQSVRAGITGMVFRKALRMSGRARQDHSVGQVITMVSTDATNLDMFVAFAAHQLWIAPIQAGLPLRFPLILGFGLLIGTLGYSALVGLGVIIIGFPIQGLLVQIMFAQRNKGIKITDKRVLLTNEVLHGIRLIKFYGWESFYIQQIGRLREQELYRIRNVSIAASLLFSVFSFVPVVATILSFLIKLPLLLLPLSLSMLAEAMVTLPRIGKLLVSPDLEDPYTFDADSKYAVSVDADFTWEVAPSLKDNGEEKSDEGKEKPTGQELSTKERKKKNKKGSKSELPLSTGDVELKETSRNDGTESTAP